MLLSIRPWRVVAVVLVLGGVGLAGYGVYEGVWRVQSVNSGVVATSGTVQSAEVATVWVTEGQRGSSDPRYVPRVTYRYVVDGHSYTGDRIYHPLDREDEGRRFESEAEAREVLGRYEPGGTATVYYFPGDPDRSFLVKPDIQVVGVLVLGLLGLFSIGLGALIERAIRRGDAADS